LDKAPQSQERGMTLDLGFSAFFVDMPERLMSHGFDKLQFTLVDCPGHASLIKTIIGGAQIIDMMLLVIDVVKGIQTQTAECLVIGEILIDDLVVVLNKVDLLPAEDREKQVSYLALREVCAFIQTLTCRLRRLPLKCARHCRAPSLLTRPS
jgi:selenocysteine-specific elongation factor